MHVASFDKTRTGVVLGVDNDTQLYTIKVDGVTYSNIKATGGVIPEVGDTVSVIFPTNNTSQMVINGSSSNSWANGVPNIIYDIVPNLVLELIYPVGAYYWSSDADFDPNEDFVGTWELLDEGITLVSAGTGYPIVSGTTKDGGDATHTLTIDEMPSHSHVRNANGGYDSNFSTGSGRTIPTNNSTGNKNNVRTASAGGGQAHNNMPPYKAAYCWHRIL